jgi:hypothetical protein
MAYYPQLISGSVAQYPLIRRAVYRTVFNQTADGRTYRLEDAGAERLEWELRYEGLSGAERRTLEEFHQEVEGRLREFTFLDPMGNLLARSGEPGASVWERGPLLTLAEGLADPAGGMSAFRLENTGSVEQSLQQVVGAPGWFTYCWSVYARSAEGSRLVLYRRSGGREDAKEYRLGEAWERLVHSGRDDSEDDRVWFGVRLAPGARVELYGMQAEAQPAPSAYRKTGERGGVYENARLAEDALQITATGPEAHACVVKIVVCGRGQ